jgi:transcriptional regulator GlxA family with amidase domain
MVLVGFAGVQLLDLARVEAARELLEANVLPVDGVATHCGFGSAETMRRSFLRVVGVGPRQYRERFTAADLAQLPGVA